MKKTTPGTTYVPSFRSTQNVNTLQERYFRSLSDAGQANFRKKSSRKLCVFKNNPHLCSALHMKKASRLANCNAGIFYSPVQNMVPTPVWSVNAPAAFFRCSATGKRNLYCSLPVFNQHIVSL